MLSIFEKSREKFEKYLKDKQQYFILLGKTGGGKLKVNNKMEIDINKLADIYYNTISRIMNA